MKSPFVKPHCLLYSLSWIPDWFQPYGTQSVDRWRIFFLFEPVAVLITLPPSSNPTVPIKYRTISGWQAIKQGPVHSIVSRARFKPSLSVVTLFRFPPENFHFPQRNPYPNTAAFLQLRLRIAVPPRYLIFLSQSFDPSFSHRSVVRFLISYVN